VPFRRNGLENALNVPRHLRCTPEATASLSHHSPTVSGKGYESLFAGVRSGAPRSSPTPAADDKTTARPWPSPQTLNFGALCSEDPSTNAQLGHDP